MPLNTFQGTGGPITKTHPAPSLSNVEIEKPWSRLSLHPGRHWAFPCSLFFAQCLRHSDWFTDGVEGGKGSRQGKKRGRKGGGERRRHRTFSGET